METLVLNAERRTVSGRKVGRLRREGLLPAVIYGPGSEPLTIQLNARQAGRLIRSIQGTQLVDLVVDGQSRKVLVHELQRDSIRGDYVHVDFYAPDMSRPFRVAIPIILTGASFAVVSLSGVLVRGITDLVIECLPGDLIPSTSIDLAPLTEIGQSLHVRDLVLPANIKVVSDPDEMLARVTYQAKEEDLSAPAAVATAEVEVVEKGKKDEEGEEGAAKPAAKAVKK
ncbi:MAG: 50S ribosomal protein L25 [Anaerolineales bacterium]|nr:50S ribosomal protein L25 [Anaerolineales bacterium]